MTGQSKIDISSVAGSLAATLKLPFCEHILLLFEWEWLHEVNLVKSLFLCYWVNVNFQMNI